MMREEMSTLTRKQATAPPAPRHGHQTRHQARFTSTHWKVLQSLESSVEYSGMQDKWRLVERFLQDRAKLLELQRSVQGQAQVCQRGHGLTVQQTSFRLMTHVMDKKYYKMFKCYMQSVATFQPLLKSVNRQLLRLDEQCDAWQQQDNAAQLKRMQQAIEPDIAASNVSLDAADHATALRIRRQIYQMLRHDLEAVTVITESHDIL